MWTLRRKKSVMAFGQKRTGARQWVPMLGIGALALAVVGSAHAQNPQPLGAVLVVPTTLVAEVKSLNEGPMPYLVTTLHTAPATIDFFPQPVTTLRIVPTDPGAIPVAALPLRLPRAAMRMIQQINNNLTLAEPTPTGEGPVATVEIAVSHQSHALDRTRFLMVPVRYMSLFLQVNPRKNLKMVYITQGNTVEWVALLAIDQADADKLQAPISAFGLDFLRSLVLLNANVAIGSTGSFDGVLITTFEVS